MKLSQVLYSAGQLAEGDQLRIAGHYRFDVEWRAAGGTIAGLAARLRITTRQAQRIAALYRKGD